MTEKSPSLDERRKLYEAAIRVKELAPWEWMAESDIFAVQDPETDDLGFVTVMGAVGEHFAVGVYLGTEGLYGYFNLLSAPDASPERLLEIPQLQASFESRSMLQKEDLETINKLGLKFRGKHAWPMFRSYRPGFAPWFLEAGETRCLTHVLEQTLDVAPRIREDPSLLDRPDEDSYLVRALDRKKGTLVWRDRIVRVSAPEPTISSMRMDPEMIASLERLPQIKQRLEVDLFLLPSPIRERGARPCYPYALLLVDAKTKLILGNELMQPQPSLEAMRESVPMKVAGLIKRMGNLPGEIKVRPGVLFDLLKPLTERLPFKLTQSNALPSVDDVKELLFSQFM
jgi:hypothetical protein